MVELWNSRPGRHSVLVEVPDPETGLPMNEDQCKEYLDYLETAGRDEHDMICSVIMEQNGIKRGFAEHPGHGMYIEGGMSCPLMLQEDCHLYKYDIPADGCYVYCVSWSR